jgi:mannose-6-phosphate isomerase-like protein (cupin superfamily)
VTVISAQQNEGHPAPEGKTRGPFNTGKQETGRGWISLLVSKERTKVSAFAALASSSKATSSDQLLFQDLSQAPWKKMLPDLGDASPEIAILHVDPKTEVTQLLIRTPKALHVRQHWHSANETHTMISGNATFACEGNRVELGPGGFNYMPARMVHEAWTTAGSVVFITVDGPWDVNWVQGPPTSADIIQ